MFWVLLWNLSVAGFFGKCHNETDTNTLWRNDLSHSIYCLVPKVGIFFLTWSLGGSVTIRFQKTSLQIVESPVCRRLCCLLQNRFLWSWNATVLRCSHWSIVGTRDWHPHRLVVAALVLTTTTNPGWLGVDAGRDWRVNISIRLIAGSDKQLEVAVRLWCCKLRWDRRLFLSFLSVPSNGRTRTSQARRGPPAGIRKDYGSQEESPPHQWLLSLPSWTREKADL